MDKLRTFFLALVGLCLTAGATLQAQTINWGSEIFSELKDSGGSVLTEIYLFELGTFDDGFLPDETNVDDWLQNWKAFDVAPYNGVEEPTDDGIFGLFASSATMTSVGGSTTYPSVFDFQGKNAYIWVRNSDIPEPGTEWFLGRATAWIFPTADPGCCPGEFPLQWSTSDLVETDTPIWGTQGGIVGGGEITQSGNYTLQTATFTVIPEPSAIALLLITLVGLTLRRRR